MSTTPTEPTAAPATPEQPKPAPPTTSTPPTTEPAGQRDADTDTPLGESGLKALREERAERERLERELKPLRDQMQALAGIFGDKATDPGKDIVATLQEQVAAMQRDNLVNDVARRHSITDDSDVELLRAAPDAETMQRLAARLQAINTGPSAPAPDPSQGSGPLSEEAAADAAYRAFFPT